MNNIILYFLKTRAPSDGVQHTFAARAYYYKKCTITPYSGIQNNSMHDQFRVGNPCIFPCISVRRNCETNENYNAIETAGINTVTH